MGSVHHEVIRLSWNDDTWTDQESMRHVLMDSFITNQLWNTQVASGVVAATDVSKMKNRMEKTTKATEHFISTKYTETTIPYTLLTQQCEKYCGEMAHLLLTTSFS